MAPPPRDHAIATLEAGQAELDSLLEGLSNTDLSEPGSIGGTDWAAKDLLGHIAFWEELGLRTIDTARAGLPSVAQERSEAELNAENQAQQAHASAAELRARAASAHEALIAAIHSLSEAEWHLVGDTLGGVLGAPDHPFGHVYAHLDDLRAFVRTR